MVFAIIAAACEVPTGPSGVLFGANDLTVAPATGGGQPVIVVPVNEPTTTTTVALAPTRVDPLWAMTPYRGLGVWVDVFDWSYTHSWGSGPAVTVSSIEKMADEGVRTIFLQTSRYDSPGMAVEVERVKLLRNVARSKGMKVVGWYLPTFEDLDRDFDKLAVMADLDLDGLAVDIESEAVEDPYLRTERLIELSHRLRAEFPNSVLGAITFPPVAMEDIRPSLWPDFPWLELNELYDVWLPMSYWSNRREDSGLKNGYTYTAANIDRVRSRVGDPNAAVHTVGGIGHLITADDLVGMRLAAAERQAIGASIYDFATTQEEHWPLLQAFRELG